MFLSWHRPLSAHLAAEADPWEIAPPFRELLSRTSVRFLKGTVKSVAPLDREGVIHAVGPGGTVRLGSGEEIVYDW
jgi:NADH dehydrogenase FAD-containing subunit